MLPCAACQDAGAAELDKLLLQQEVRRWPRREKSWRLGSTKQITGTRKLVAQRCG
jgi:hypothetical protein